METGELGLAEAIQAVRAELARAQELGVGNDVRFTVGQVEVEFVVELTTTAGGDAAVKVLGVFSATAHGERAKGETHRVTVSLNPLGKGGQPFEVRAAAMRRPDGAAAGADQEGKPDVQSAR